MPYDGETLTSENYFQAPGGKAVNQAVAATRMGKRTSLIGKVGSDAFGKEVKECLKQEGLQVDYIFTSTKHRTGNAFVLMDQHGNNSIITNLGANQALSIPEVQSVLASAKNAKIALLQLEMPKDVRDFIIKELHKLKIKTVLNLAPVVEMSRDVRKLVDILIVNEVEATQLTNYAVVDDTSAKKAAGILASEGNETVIITLGAQGAFVQENSNCYTVSAPKVNVIDTSGAGDCFCGSLAAFLLETDLHGAVQKAVTTAAHAVTRRGTMEAIPYLHDLKI